MKNNTKKSALIIFSICMMIIAVAMAITTVSMIHQKKIMQESRNHSDETSKTEVTGQDITTSGYVTETGEGTIHTASGTDDTTAGEGIVTIEFTTAAAEISKTEPTTTVPEVTTVVEITTGTPSVTEKPVDTTEPCETTKASESTKASETTGHETTTKPTETTKPIETTKPSETTAKPIETTAPEETTKPIETEPVVTECIHSETEVRGAVKVGCTTNGYSGDTCCKSCGKLLKSGSTISFSGHKSTVLVAAKKASCATAGCTEGTKCSVCGITLVASKTIAATGHTEYVSKQAKAATCKTDGYTETVKCSVCGTVIKAQQTIKANGQHDYQYCEAVAPTCSTLGYTAGVKCILCGDIPEGSTRKSQMRLDHTVVIDPAIYSTDCVTPGYTEGSHCGVCGKILAQRSETKAYAHDFSVLVSKVEATNDTYGYSIYKCSRCGMTDPNGHDVTGPLVCLSVDWKRYSYGTCQVGDEATGVTNGMTPLQLYGLEPEVKAIDISSVGQYYHPMDATVYPYTGEPLNPIQWGVLICRDGTVICGQWSYYDKSRETEDLEAGITWNPGWTFAMDWHYLETGTYYGWCYNRFINDFTYGYWVVKSWGNGTYRPYDTLCGNNAKALLGLAYRGGVPDDTGSVMTKFKSSIKPLLDANN